MKRSREHPRNRTSKVRASALLALLLLGLGLWCLGCGKSEGRVVLLISIDSLRQDHLGCYGYGRDTSPNLDRFVREDAVLFDAAYAQAPYTLPSHMSMLTGLYPEAHGVLLPVRSDQPDILACLRERITTLAEVFAESGFRTTAFTDDFLMKREFGFDQGFEAYRDISQIEAGRYGFRKYGKALHQWVEANSGEDFFLFLHTFDVHAPFDGPDEYAAKFRGTPAVRDLPAASMLYCSLLGIHNSHKVGRYLTLQDMVDDYDGCIAFVDDELGKLFALLKQLGLWEDALIVVTSDHGESFMENGVMIGHGVFATNEETLIPLLIKLPGSPHAGTRIDHLVESIDIMPTVLAARGLAVPPGVQGQNLITGLEGKGWAKDYAFGISPSVGGRHYFIRDQVKYLADIADPEGRQMRLNLMPGYPFGTKKPDAPYCVVGKKEYFYDFDSDPLGLIDLFRRREKVFDLKDGRFEWKGEEIRDAEVIESFKKAAGRLSRASRELGETFGGESASRREMADEFLVSLTGLGYAGVAHGLQEKGRTHPSGNRNFPELPTVKRDRTLLHQGDNILWRSSRSLMQNEKALAWDKADALLEEARSCYLAFKAENPDREEWVLWRITYLEKISSYLKSQKRSGR